MIIFLKALALVFIIEGICFALFPGRMRKAMLHTAALPESYLRALGGLALATALLIMFGMRLFQ